MTSDNKSLGRFILDGIPPAPRGLPQVEVTFDVDANGILSVKAKDKTTGKEQTIRIEARSGLSDADIERMKKDAEVNAETDKKSRELAEIRNIAEQLVYSAEKSLQEHGAKIPDDVKKGVTDAIEALKNAKGTGDIEGIKNATQTLNTEMQKIGQFMSKENEQGGGGNAAGPQEGSEPEQNPPEGTVRDV